MPRRRAKKSGEKPTTIDHEQRSRHAEKLLAGQWSYSRVREELMREFKVCERTAEGDIATAYERIRASDDGERPARKATMRRSLMEHYQLCVKTGDLATGVRTLAQLCRLDGLDDPKRIELSGAVATPRSDVNWNDVPLQKRRELLAAMDEVDRIAKGQAAETPTVEHETPGGS